MTNIPSDRRYSKDHEWVLSLGRNEARIGITDHAQRQLGDIVFVEQPRVGDRFDAAEPFGSVESVKAVSEIFMPVGGTVSTINDTLGDDPETLNTDPYGDGWIVQVGLTDSKELDELLSAEQYEDYIGEKAR
ncbi:glycine cleavage system protein GcvH [Kitasatospora sp. NBC_00315]|uniref:glycine cleavage system protein GcvH n=1 Tax=Kitasatospora sp. NBC_00315 TaxID=2975963 RepID=UPI0032438614